MRLVLALLMLMLTTALQAQQSDRIYREGFEKRCTFLPFPLRLQRLQSYASWFGVPFGSGHVWKGGYVTNESLLLNPLDATRVGVDSYSFQAPAPERQGSLRTSSTEAGVFYAITDQCGTFDTSQRGCKMGNNGAIVWSTKADAPEFHCKLEQNRTYYMNVGYFDRNAYQGRSAIIPTCLIQDNCNTQTCSYTCNYHHYSQ